MKRCFLIAKCKHREVLPRSPHLFQGEEEVQKRCPGKKAEIQRREAREALKAMGSLSQPGAETSPRMAIAAVCKFSRCVFSRASAYLILAAWAVTIIVSPRGSGKLPAVASNNEHVDTRKFAKCEETSLASLNAFECPKVCSGRILLA